MYTLEEQSVLIILQEQDITDKLRGWEACVEWEGTKEDVECESGWKERRREDGQNDSWIM